MTRSLLAALALGALCTVLIAAVLLDVGNSSAELLSGEDALASRLVQYQAAPLRRTVRESGSQLADLVDSPLMLAKQKIDQYLDEDNTDLAGSTAKMHVVGSGKGGAPCTSLRCNHGAYQNDYLEEAEDRLDQAMNPAVEDPGKKPLSSAEKQEFMDADGELAGIAEDDTMQELEVPSNMNAITKALMKKLKAMKQNFREIRAKFENGPAKVIRIDVKPRGPRGPPGVPGNIGPSGLPGPVGSYGHPGRKGPPGPMGVRGDRGKKGRTGLVGSIGKPGGMGATGYRGYTGPQGFTGAPGSRGLPGAAGAPGTNGKDGPPGPPGRNSPEGPPGPTGPKGQRGATGSPGTPGRPGAPGLKGQTGKTGEPGRQGPTGKAGLDGAGPLPAKAIKKSGPWPKLGCWTKGGDCVKLGVSDNLCGQCEPLCKRCGSKAGFMLSATDGLRFKGYSFDDNAVYVGSNMVRNMCMLARYGNKGTFKGNTADIVSAKSYAESSRTKEQPHFYGRCTIGDKSQEACCSNSKLVSSGFDWLKFATGNQCGSDLDKDWITSKVVCIFDEKAMQEAQKPPDPRDGDSMGGFLVSQGELDETTYRSKNGKFDFVLDDGGAMLVQKDKKTIWSKVMTGKKVSPYKMVMGKDGDLIVYNGAGDAVWTAGTKGSGTQVRLTDKGCLTVMDANDECYWSSCGCLNTSPPTVPDPPANTLFNTASKSILNIRCANWRDKKTSWSKSKQIQYYSKCMAQDCEQSLESGESTPGCRFLDENGFCYAYGSAQKWCANNLGFKDCNDGGMKWATAPVGTAASVGKTEWSPQQSVLVYGSAGDGKETYGCQCMKDCTCYKDKCRCADLASRPLPLKKQGQYNRVIGDGSVKSQTAGEVVFSTGKIIKDGSKMRKCSCRCGEAGDVFEAA